ncbi:hypothetical protein [Derxia gummosa]|uniref:Uncharacterized protein n=1 Tax=Derxia gummosa DSM 723 TaxID=1121388 RepID=A0A8B6X3I5_9BURK|nr:hypothetical protein [Derxia gummosa]
MDIDGQWSAQTHAADRIQESPKWPAHRPAPDFRAHERAFVRRLLLLMLLSSLYFVLGWQRLQPESVARWLAPDHAEMQEPARENCARYAEDVNYEIVPLDRELSAATDRGRAGICAWRAEIADMLGIASGAGTTEIAGLEVEQAGFPWSEVEVTLTRRSLARLPDGRLRRLTSDERLRVRNVLFGREIVHVAVRVRLDDDRPTGF